MACISAGDDGIAAARIRAGGGEEELRGSDLQKSGKFEIKRRSNEVRK
jgi:hypothetical protein